MDLSALIKRTNPFQILGMYGVVVLCVCVCVCVCACVRACARACVCLCVLFSFSNFDRTFCIAANSGDLDHTPLTTAYDLGLHYLPISHKKDAWLIWVKPACTATVYQVSLVALFCLSLNVLYVSFVLYASSVGSSANPQARLSLLAVRRCDKYEKFMCLFHFGLSSELPSKRD